VTTSVTLLPQSGGIMRPPRGNSERKSFLE
jgi:hypothetical protein